jgi:hypothetical protein
LGERIISEGIPTHSVVFTRKVMEEALRLSASAVVVVHNHHSGEAKPSLQDIETTQKLKQATGTEIVRLLEKYNLSDTSEDIKGVAFESFFGRTFRGEIGQFFTPRSIVEFMVHMIDFKEGEIVCDPASVSGGFLIRVFEMVRELILADAYRQYNDFKDKLSKDKKLSEEDKAVQLRQKFDEIQQTIDQRNEGSRMWKLSNRCIYGTDANDRMASTSKMNMIMHGDGHGGVHHHDGFLNVNGIFEGRFDIILTNPPFDANVEPSDKILGVNNTDGIFHAYDALGKEIKQPYKKVSAGNFAYNPYRINVGSIGWVPDEHDGAFISPAYAVFSIDEKIILPELFWFILKSDFFNKTLRAATAGSVRMNDMPSKLIKEPFSYCISLSDVISDLQNGWSPKCMGRKAEGNKWGILNVGAVSFGSFDENQNKALPSKLKPREQYEIKSGDLIISRANINQYVGACALVENVRSKLMLCDKLFRVVWKQDSPILSEYLNEILKKYHISAGCGIWGQFQCHIIKRERKINV